MTQNKNLVEESLLTGKSLDELIRIRMNEKVQEAFSQIKKTKLTEKITDIKKIPAKILFSKKAVFKKYNKLNDSLSFINGIQAESLIGMEDNIREKLKNGEIDVFSTDDAFIKFEYVEI